MQPGLQEGATLTERTAHQIGVHAERSKTSSPARTSTRPPFTMFGFHGETALPAVRLTVKRSRAILCTQHPIDVLNAGGVANATYFDGGNPIGCDTGPGCADR